MITNCNSATMMQSYDRHKPYTFQTAFLPLSGISLLLHFALIPPYSIIAITTSLFLSLIVLYAALLGESAWFNLILLIEHELCHSLTPLIPNTFEGEPDQVLVTNAPTWQLVASQPNHPLQWKSRGCAWVFGKVDWSLRFSYFASSSAFSAYFFSVFEPSLSTVEYRPSSS